MDEGQPLPQEAEGGGLREWLASTAIEHAALARAQERLAGDLRAEDVITSYDRMHHRHSRS